MEDTLSNESGFHGPLFLVDMPRSGTKLLRALLVGNPIIKIPPSETNFIPYLVNRFGKTPEFTDESILKAFYSEFSRTSFYWSMKKKGLSLEYDSIISADLSTWSTIFKYIIRYYSSDSTSEDIIWGDKSPAYVNHMIILKETFPESKFLHIIRDPRDYSLSVKKTWGKNIYRAASKWNDGMNALQSNISKLGNDYMQLHFEDLLDKPKDVILEICDFLGCEFNENMIKLKYPSEFVGSAKGETRIVKENKNKYLTELSSRQIKRIEQIVFSAADSMPYKLKYATYSKPLNKLMLQVYKLLDGMALMIFHVREKGFFQGLKYVYQGYNRSLRI